MYFSFWQNCFIYVLFGFGYFGKNSNSLYSLLQTPKNLRTNIETIKVNLDFNFLSNQIDVNRIKLNDIKDNDQALRILKELNEIENLNFHKARRIFNKVLEAYFG